MAKPEHIVSELPPEAVANTHDVATRVEILVDGQVEETLDAAIDGNVTLDAKASARGRIDLTIAGVPELIPTGPDSLLNVYGNEIAAFRGIEFADRIELVPLGVFRIDDSGVSDDGVATVNVAALDRSGRISDAKFEKPGEIAAGSDALDTIVAGLQAAWSAVPIGDLVEVSVPLPALVYDEGGDPWEFYSKMATAIGCELYFDRLGQATVQRIPTAVSGDPVAEFAEGEGGVLLGVDRHWERPPVTNWWKVTADNTTGDDSVAPPTAIVFDSNPLSPTYYFGRFGQKRDFWSNPFVASQVQCEDAAAGLLARSIGEPDKVNFNVLVDPARSPSDVVRITRERLEIEEDYIVDTITIPLAAEAGMPGTTRKTQVLS